MKKYLIPFEKELQVAAEMSGIEINDAEEMVDAYFKAIDYLMDDERIPTISVQSLGILRFTKSKLNRIFATRSEGSNSKVIVREDTKRKLNIQVDYITKRKEKESKKEFGVGFWWSFVPKNFATQLLEKENKKEDGE